MRRPREIDQIDILFFTCLILVCLVAIAMAVVLSSCSAPSVPDLPRRTPQAIQREKDPELLRVATTLHESVVREPVFVGRRRCGSMVREPDGQVAWRPCAAVRRLAMRIER